MERRRRLNAQGEPGGCHIDLSQTETATSFTGEAVTAYSISGEDPGRRGNYHPRIAPHNTYLCSDDSWIAIACETDAQFADLSRLIGREDWIQRWPEFTESRRGPRKSMLSFGCWNARQGRAAVDARASGLVSRLVRSMTARLL